MALPQSSPTEPARAAWAAALAEVGGRPGLRERLARPSEALIERFSATYAQLRALPRAQRRRLARRLRVGLAGAALLLALGLTSAPALAATITVDGTACTLAQAITTANDGTAQGSCTQGDPAGPDTIDLQIHVGLTEALPQITSEITLEGNGHTVSRSSGELRILNVGAAGNLTLNSATLSGGSVSAGGGGIYNDYGTLTVQNSTISGNSAGGGGGGGIYNNYGTLTVQNSTISGNLADDGGGIHTRYGTLAVLNSTITGNAVSSSGGGIIIRGGTETVQNTTISGNSASLGGGGIEQENGTVAARNSTMTVQNSTLSGNMAKFGGGILVQIEGVLTVENSTLSGNSATYAGGILAFGTLMLQNSTLTGNSAQHVGGLYNWNGTVTVQSSIIALQNPGDDCGGPLTSGGYNIESGTSCGFTQIGDQQTVSTTDLKLDPLADNGGPTWTHALGVGSVAIEQIPIEMNGCGIAIAADQRGAPRAGGVGKGGHACEVGAYEYASGAPTAITLRTLGVGPGPAIGGLAGVFAALTAVLGGLALRWRSRTAG